MKHQKGYIWLDRRRKCWFGRWREDTLVDGKVVHKQRAEKLADYNDRFRYKTDVKSLLEEKLSSVNKGARYVGNHSNMQLVPFVENVYFPYVEQQKHKSTEKGYREKWRNYVKPLCSELWLRDVRTCEVQHILSSIAAGHELSHTTLQRCKTLLSAIFSFAKRQGYFDGENPATNTEIPAGTKSSEETYAYTLDEINEILLQLPNPAHAIVAVASYAGLTKSEIEGLRWENYNGKELSVARARVHGVFGEPKTKRRKGAVPVIPRLKAILDHYRLSRGNPQIGVMFANSAGEPEWLDNLCGRVIRPALNRCVVCRKSAKEHAEGEQKANHEFEQDKSIPEWHGYHACRRGLATNLHDLGIDDLTIQRIMRHSSVSVTQRCYIKTLPKQVTDAMRKLDRAAGIVQQVCSNPKYDKASNSRQVPRLQ